jgi:DNA mismatch endonuclease (patch repair protein)
LGDLTLCFRSISAAVFVHGCFWHRHEGCRYTTTPSTRQDFWQAKFEANVTRDRAVLANLLGDGWRVATIWECALRKAELVETVSDLLASWIEGTSCEIAFGETEVKGT